MAAGEGPHCLVAGGNAAAAGLVRQLPLHADVVGQTLSVLNAQYAQYVCMLRGGFVDYGWD